MKKREEKILEGLDLSRCLGAEIGPLSRPLVEKSDGKVIYIDYADKETLREKYKNDPSVDVNQIDVDATWGAQTLGQALASLEFFSPNILLDYVIASHVIEHVPDLITWLHEIRSVLKDGGELRLAIPDRRFTFDYLRRNSELPEILTAYLQKSRIPNAYCILDFCLNEVPVDARSAWEGSLDPADLNSKHAHTLQGAIAVARDSLLNGNYHDIHCWTFTPESIGRLFATLSENDLFEFSCENFYDTELNDIEFFLNLKVCLNKKVRVESWRRMEALARR